MQVESDSLASGLIAYRFFDVPSFRVWGCHEGNTSIQNVNSLPINQTVKESLYPPPACQTGAGWRWSGAAPGHDQLGRRRLAPTRSGIGISLIRIHRFGVIWRVDTFHYDSQLLGVRLHELYLFSVSILRHDHVEEFHTHRISPTRITGFRGDFEGHRWISRRGDFEGHRSL